MTSSDNFQVPGWTEKFSALHDIVCQARTSTSDSIVQTLNYHLNLRKQDFINLLDDPPKNPQDRSTLQGGERQEWGKDMYVTLINAHLGKAYVNTTLHKVNQGFIDEALLLSDQLGINEHVAATLLMNAITQSERVNANRVDTAVILFHNEREYLLACLDVILKSAKDTNVNESVRHVYIQFMAEICRHEIPSVGSFAAKILQTIKKLGDTIASLSTTGTVATAGQPSNAAATTTVLSATSTTSGGRLGEEIYKTRMERLKDERISLAQILYHVASLFWLEPKDVFSLVDILEDADLTQITTPYLLITLVGALSVQSHADNAFHYNEPLYASQDFVAKFQKHIEEKPWRVKAAKSLVTLQWVTSLYALAQMDRVFESRLPASEEKLEQLVDDAVSKRVFNFINDYILYFQQPSCDYSSHDKIFKWSVYAKRLVEPNLTVEASDFEKFNADIRLEFQPFVILQIESIVTEFIDKLPGTLRKLKYREEDTNAAVVSATNTQTSSMALEREFDQKQEPQQCRDLEAFFDTLASVYRNRVNAGAKFWVRADNRLYGFIKWATDIKVTRTMRACYNFLASISTGQFCADSAFHFLDDETNKADIKLSSLFSWGKLVAALQYYTQLLANSTTETEIPYQEEEALIAFLLLLRQTVQYSSAARMALWAAEPYCFAHWIFQMLGRNLSYDLGAALFNVLTAFCSNRGVNVEIISRQIAAQALYAFQRLDYMVTQREGRQHQSQLSTELGYQRSNQPEDTSSWFITEYNMEKSSKSYNKTLAVLNFVSSVIHVQSKRDSLLHGFVPIMHLIPWYTGKDTRPPGAEPYISIILDHIFKSLDSQDYTSSESRWQLTEACLKVMENSVESFDFRPLEATVSGTTNAANPNHKHASPAHLQEALAVYVTHPGFTVISHLLSGKSVVHEILKIIEHGPKGIMEKAEKSPYFVRSLTRCLRIINRVLSIQDKFANLLLPQIRAASTTTSTSEYKLGNLVFPPLPSVVPFGQLMLNRANCIVQLALLINCEDQVEICYLATKILHALSTEATKSSVKSGNIIPKPMGGLGSRLTMVLKSCKEGLNVLLGFSERLAIDDYEQTTANDYDYDINNIPFWLAEKVLSDPLQEQVDFVPANIVTSVRLAIVELLLDNASLQAPTPSLCDFFLGYSRAKWAWGDISSTVDEKSKEASMVCLNTIVSLLQRGIPADNRDDTANELPLIATHPILAEKCYELMYTLCTREATSYTTLRYLESKQDFFYRQFKALSPRLETFANVSAPNFAGIVSNADGTQMVMDFYVLLSQLRQRTWLLQAIALELHVMVGKRRTTQVRRLLKLLYGREQANDDDGNSNNDGQGNVDMEIDGNVVSTSDNAYFQQPLVKMLELVSSLEFTWTDELAPQPVLRKLKYFDLDFSKYEICNERGCLVYDIRGLYMDLYAVKLVKRLSAPPDVQADIDNELGHVMQVLMAENHQREIANARTQCLQAWKQIVQVTLSECFDLFPFQAREKIIYGLLSMLLPKMTSIQTSDHEILRGLSEVILRLLTRLREDKQKQTDVNSSLPTEKLRTIFYGILNCILREGVPIAVRGNMYTTLVNLVQYVESGPSNIIQSHLVDVIANNTKLLETLCIDASDGFGIWKTSAYTALNCLCKVSQKAGNRAILTFLTKNNFLRGCIDIIRREDAALVGILTKATGKYAKVK